jgi:hypothetical protein
MPNEAHQLTKAEFNRWKAEYRHANGGKFDWKHVPESDIIVLSNRMFDAAKTPKTVVDAYWRRYHAMMVKINEKR